MKTSIGFVLAFLMGGTLLLTAPRPAAAKKSPIVRTLRIVVGAVRYGRHNLALKYFAGKAQGRVLLGKHWSKVKAGQRSEFVSLFKTLFAKIALRRVEAKFKYLKTIVYGTPKVKGNTAHVDSTIVILHALKKQEMQLRYELRKVAGKWKVLDVTTMGDSMLQGIRDKQIYKIWEKGGWKRLILAMRRRAQQLAQIKLK